MVDIRTVHVDMTEPVSRRARAFSEQIGDCSRFRCGEITVNVRYGERPRIECVASLLTGAL